MSYQYPSKVFITEGGQPGGVRSFAEGLGAGFAELGIAVEIVAASRLLRRWGELRNPRTLKILSTAAVFGAPLARRTLCMAHGVPCAAHQGWPTALAVLASFKISNASRGTQLVAVSDYAATHLQAIFGLRADAVIRNPVRSAFLESDPEPDRTRTAITYVGRLHRSKNVDKLLPAIRAILDENPGLSAWVIGDGPLRAPLEQSYGEDARIEFLGWLGLLQVRERLRLSRVFVSGNPVEPLGIAYLEALGQGCAVAMPACGGGLEIAPEQIGGRVHLFPLPMACADIAGALRRALRSARSQIELGTYSARAVAEAYLASDARFNAQGMFHSAVSA